MNDRPRPSPLPPSLRPPWMRDALKEHPSLLYATVPIVWGDSWVEFRSPSWPSVDNPNLCGRTLRTETGFRHPPSTRLKMICWNRWTLPSPLPPFHASVRVPCSSCLVTHHVGPHPETCKLSPFCPSAYGVPKEERETLHGPDSESAFWATTYNVSKLSSLGSCARASRPTVRVWPYRFAVKSPVVECAPSASC